MATIKQIENLLDHLRVTNRKLRGNEINFCCPIHGELHPSCSINIVKEAFNCFACGAKGSLAYFLYLSAELRSIQEAEDVLEKEFGIIKADKEKKNREIKRYDDLTEEEPKREVLSRIVLAPFKSGKETYKYFHDRGFTKEIVQEFLIGRDLINKTVTIPVFWEDNSLAGVIGRYVTKRAQNERYRIYDFKRSKLLYPLNKVEIKDEVILVEGNLDALRMYQYGYKNTLALMTNSISINQINILKRLTDDVILFLDNDSGGYSGIEKIVKKLKGEFNLKIVSDYPEYGKDVCDWSKKEIGCCLNNAKTVLRLKNDDLSNRLNAII